MRIVARVGIVALSVGTLAACTSGNPEEAAQPSAQPDFITAEQFCGALSTADLAPLRDGPVSDRPQETTDEGLPGCKWPVSDGWGWLKMEVFSPASVDALIQVSKSSYPVGAGTAYRQLQGSPGDSCSGAIVTMPNAPTGYVLNLKYDRPVPIADASDACQKTTPQVEKVLKKLGWWSA